MKDTKIFKTLVIFIFFFFVSNEIYSCQIEYFSKKNILILDKDKNKSFTFVVEIAKSSHEKKKGLQCRKYLKENEGMLFTWDFEDYRYFWMKNTNVPLDIIFIDSNFKIVDIFSNAQPNTLDLITSKEKAMYILELNAGISKNLGLKNGDMISF